MGVSTVQGYNESQVLSLQSAKKALPFLQPQGLTLHLYYEYTLHIPVHTRMYWYVPVHTILDAFFAGRVQDTVLVVLPYPYFIEEDCSDVPLEDCWTARPQLFFSCFLRLRPKGGRMPKTASYKIGPDDLRICVSIYGTDSVHTSLYLTKESFPEIE